MIQDYILEQANPYRPAEYQVVMVTKLGQAFLKDSWLKKENAVHQLQSFGSGAIVHKGTIIFSL